ncbi:helix-hairpin-helix domain-containing protein [soil metagenome]
MRRIKAWVRGFFGFSRRETNAFIILLPLMVIILFSEPVYRHLTTGTPGDHSKEDRELDSLLATLTFLKVDSVDSRKKSRNATLPAVIVIPFYSFDPNTITEEEFITLGLSSYLASRIGRYREKGGKFKKKEDLQRIYGMDSAWFKKASPWIRIVNAPKNPFPIKTMEKSIYVVETHDINSADSTELMKVYGIGPALSKRICTFRDRLGGYISIEQLNEVYGLDTAVLKSLKKKFFVKESFSPQQISINQMKAEEVRHPYLRRKEVQAIIAFRTQHGNFQSLEQLMEIKILSAEWIEKVRPYLKVE